MVHLPGVTVRTHKHKFRDPFKNSTTVHGSRRNPVMITVVHRPTDVSLSHVPRTSPLTVCPPSGQCTLTQCCPCLDPTSLDSRKLSWKTLTFSEPSDLPTKLPHSTLIKVEFMELYSFLRRSKVCPTYGNPPGKSPSVELTVGVSIPGRTTPPPFSLPHSAVGHEDRMKCLVGYRQVSGVH